MSQTIKLLDSINDIMEKEEDFNEKAYKDFLWLKEELNNKLWYVIDEISKYDGLGSQSKKLADDHAKRYKYYSNQSKKWKSFLTFVIQKNGDNKIETGAYRISPSSSCVTWVWKFDSLPNGTGNYIIKLSNDWIDKQIIQQALWDTAVVSIDADKSAIKQYIESNDLCTKFATLEEAKAASLWDCFMVYDGQLYSIDNTNEEGHISAIAWKQENKSVTIK